MNKREKLILDAIQSWKDNELTSDAALLAIELVLVKPRKLSVKEKCYVKELIYSFDDLDLGHNK